jgi:hypothetical protein
MDKRDELVKQLQQKKKKPDPKRTSSPPASSKPTTTYVACDSPCVISQTPPEVLLQIFSYADRELKSVAVLFVSPSRILILISRGLSTRELLNCMQVCKQWRALSSSKFVCVLFLFTLS